MKVFLLVLGFLAALLIVAQLVMGQLILSGGVQMDEGAPAFGLYDGRRHTSVHWFLPGVDRVSAEAAAQPLRLRRRSVSRP